MPGGTNEYKRNTNEYKRSTKTRGDDIPGGTNEYKRSTNENRGVGNTCSFESCLNSGIRWRTEEKEEEENGD